MDYEFPREEFVLKFEGPGIRNHEMEISTLVNSLLAFKTAVECSNTSLNGKNSFVSVKIQGGFQAGSLLTKIIADYVAPVAPLLPQAINALKGVIELKKFLGGESPVKTEQKGDGKVEVHNTQGNVNVFNTSVVIMNNSGPVNNALGRLFKPLEEGANEISLMTGIDDPSPTKITSEEKHLVIPPVDEQEDVSSYISDLEVLTSNIDGKASGWRFYDTENDIEFSASVSDENFLSDVKNKKYNFQRGDQIKATVNSVKKMVSQRKRTERFITDITTHIRPE